MNYGGEDRIRTCDTVSRINALQAFAFDHSATSPTLQPPPRFLHRPRPHRLHHRFR